jgi:hypothetical protein
MFAQPRKLRGDLGALPCRDLPAPLPWYGRGCGGHGQLGVKPGGCPNLPLANQGNRDSRDVLHVRHHCRGGDRVCGGLRSRDKERGHAGESGLSLAVSDWGSSCPVPFAEKSI